MVPRWYLQEGLDEVWVISKGFCIPDWHRVHLDLTLCNGNLDVQPALSVLAIVSRTAPFDKQLLKIPRHLQHFAYYPIDADSEHNMDMAECTTFDLPPNLRSFTFVSSAPERYHCLTAIEIGEACKRVGATFVHVAGQRAKDWDADEWAYSLEE
ncbi:hypothetical protein JCM10296v2_007203 [Rhodotorula toruloides]